MLNRIWKFVCKIPVYTFRCISCGHIFQTMSSAGKCSKCGSYETTMVRKDE
jgi:DNA polymerase II large subunit